MNVVKLGDLVEVVKKGKKDKRLVLKREFAERLKEEVKGVKVFIDEVENEISLSKGIDGYIAVKVDKRGWDSHVYIGERWGVILEWDMILPDEYEEYRNIPILVVNDDGEAIIPWEEAVKRIRAIQMQKRQQQKQNK